MKKKAIALVSGGLDSLLAARVIQEQGIEVLGITFVMQFASRNLAGFKGHVQEAAAESGMPIRFQDISKDFLEMLKKPKHGYGANINPCIDCKIMMLRNAKRVMEEEGAHFVVTGEVLGERPMSQRREALNTIEKHSALKGYLLRPLCAKLMRETQAEKDGIVEREKLLDIRGRSREPQLALAKKYGITKFFAPAGGCLLTDPIFARKLKDLLSHGMGTMEEVSLLKYGRHFRLDDITKIIVGRDEKENDKLLELKAKEDVVLRLEDKNGPYALLKGESCPENLKKAAALVLSHSKHKNEDGTKVEYWANEDQKNILSASSIDRVEIDRGRVA
ncbi:MAG: tRNA 4-thiouridine(8) synthase ThiI [Candidatus Omnitrophota bacterium]